MVVTIMFWLYCLVITLICIFIFAACRLAGDADEIAEHVIAAHSIAPATDIEDLCILSGAEGWSRPAREREAS